jgi:hypothetical protein
MKNTIINVIAIVAVIGLFSAGCAGGAKPASGADELDAAIREASDYLNTRIPNGNKVAFINISGGYPDLADYILSDLSKHGVNDGIFSVVDRALLDQVREELNFNMSGEVSDQSAQAIGQMLGAQTIVSGSVRKIGALYRLDVKAIEVQTAGVQGQWNRNIPDGATIAALTTNTASGTTTASGGRASTAGATTGGGAAQAATPAAPTRPANGTYTFFPRLQASQGGRNIDEYIDKIIIKGNYFIMYVTNVTIGRSPYSTRMGWDDKPRIILQDIDRPSRTFNMVDFVWDVEDRVLTFENVTVTRFSLINNTQSPPFIFEEIDLSKAEYEP